MNIADIKLTEALQTESKPVDQGNREDLFKVILLGIVIRGGFDWEKPHHPILNAWNMAKTAAEVMERA